MTAVTRSVVVLSPHPDDAAFSAWHVLDGDDDVLVVSVFAGVPEPGFVAPLDRAHGANESASWMRRRRAEDAEALEVAGRRPVHLSLLDVLYRAHEADRQLPDDPAVLLPELAADPALRTPPDRIVREVSPLVGADTVVYAPAGVGGHPDHRDVGLAALELAGVVREVRLYADTPYYQASGLPSVQSEVPNPRADRLVADALLTLGTEAAAAHPVTLSQAKVERKMRALRCYRTEFDPVNEDFGGIAGDPGMMRHELWWSLP